MSARTRRLAAARRLSRPRWHARPAVDGVPTGKWIVAARRNPSRLRGVVALGWVSGSGDADDLEFASLREASVFVAFLNEHLP